MTLSLGMSIADHGKERSPENGWSSAISYVLLMALLYYGGFFNLNNKQNERTSNNKQV